MRQLLELGLPQGVLPPQERPHVPTLRRLGFVGSDREIIQAVAKADPTLLANVYSASSMWAANAATVSPSTDTADGRVHFTTASLGSMFHRSIETKWTERLLPSVFADEEQFMHHEPLPVGGRFGDEGAANHTRLCETHDQRGVEVFVYGWSAFESANRENRTFAPRQAREASRAVARLHGLDPAATVFLKQSQAAIDAGAFHNDVVCVGNQSVIFAHQRALEDGPDAWDRLRAACPFELTVIEASEAELSLQDAISSYVFNSQLVTLPGEDAGMALILPEEARLNENSFKYVTSLNSGRGPIRRIEFVNVRESMGNGGGPACLRLRLVLTEAEQAAISGRVVLDQLLIKELEDWVARHYRESLDASDLRDPQMYDETCSALDELSSILKLGSIYDFQRV